MTNPESDDAGCDGLWREFRGKALSTGVLILQSMEQASGAITRRDASGMSQVFDLHESVEALTREAREIAERLLTAAPCDEFLLRRVVSTLAIGHLLGRISTRALEMAAMSPEITEAAETESVRLLDPLLSRVNGILRGVVTAFADSDVLAAAAVSQQARDLEALEAGIATQLRSRVMSNKRFAVVNLGLLQLAQLVVETGALAVEIADKVRQMESWGGTGSAFGSGPGGGRLPGIGLSA